MRAADFLDSLGIGTQLGATGSTDAGRVDGMLDYLGIDNVRQSAPTDAATSALMAELGRLGARFDLIVNGNGPVTLHGALGTIASFKPFLDAVEGPNEVDLFPMSYPERQASGFDAAIRFQEDLYTALRADPSYNDIDVYSFSLANILPSTNPGYWDVSAFADAASVHSYAASGMRPAWVLPYHVVNADDIASRDPVVMTETGYYTLPGNRNWGGVTEGVQAQYGLDTLFGNALRGIERTYLFNLIDTPDPGNNDREAHFGAFRADGSAKPLASALHNLTTILADDGADAASFATRDVGYAVSGLPFTQASMQLHKSDGTHVIAVWNEEDLWNEANGTEIASPHYGATVRLDRAYDTVRVYDPMVGASPIATLHNVSSVTADISSHPVLIQLGDNLPGAAPALATSATTVPAAAPRTLVLTASEDAWRGDAQFTVKVDGVQVGGVNTVTASRGDGRSQDFTFNGNWAAGPHRVSVEFLNDAYGGTPSTDRNLYVEGLDFGGAHHGGATIHAGSANFDLLG